MAVHFIIKQPIADYQGDHIDFLYEHRKGIKNSDIRTGINISIIIHSACCIEGFLEYNLTKLLYKRKEIINKVTFEDFSKRRIFHSFLNKLEMDLEAKISKTTGIDNFNSLIDLFSYRNNPVNFKQFKHWEGITVLFQLRNVLAHGRQVSAKRVIAYFTQGAWEDDFVGGYRKAESYLLKKNLVKHNFTEAEKINHIFTNKVTDHFFSITRQFIKFAENIFETEMNESKVEMIVKEEFLTKSST